MAGGSFLWPGEMTSSVGEEAGVGFESSPVGVRFIS